MELDRRDNISRILNDKEYKLGIEVGTFVGEFSKTILSTWNGILYCLDVWRGMDDYKDSSNISDPIKTISLVLDNVKGYEDRCVLIRTTSKYGSTMFPDEYFDFIYIDANHKYKYVKEDISCWYPKIKKGGMMSGHDYIRDYNSDRSINGLDTNVWLSTGEYCGVFGVNPVVDEFCKDLNKMPYITNEYFGTWYIFK